MAVKKRSGGTGRSSLAERILARRKPGGAEVSLERLEADFADASRYEIVASLKELEKAGRGQFVVGRKGQRSRFVWGEAAEPPPARLAKKIRGKRPAPAASAPAGEGAPVLASEPSKGPARQTLAPVGKRLERATLSSPRAAEAPPARRQEPGSAARARLLQHSFHLRPGVLVSIELPEDVSSAEVERFCSFLKAIPFATDDRR